MYTPALLLSIATRRQKAVAGSCRCVSVGNRSQKTSRRHVHKIIIDIVLIRRNQPQQSGKNQIDKEEKLNTQTYIIFIRQ